MNTSKLIGIDAGTSVIKAVAFDIDGRQIASSGRRNEYRTLANGGVEQDMEATWVRTVEVLRELVDVQPELATQTIGLCVTGQGDGTWLVGENGRPLHDGWLWLDARASEESREILASEGIETVYRASGTGVNICQMRTHLLWLKRHQPELLSQARTAQHCKDWLYGRLTGERATDLSEAVMTFGDFRKRIYSDALLEALGYEDLRHLLPPIVDGTKQSRPLLANVASATGLPAGLPVSLGSIDVVCSAVGAGLYDDLARPGLTVLGSTGAHMKYAANADEVILNPDRSGYTLPLPGPAYAQLQTNMAATLNIDWILGLALEILCAQGVKRSLPDLLQSIDGQIMDALPGKALFHPYISAAGERGPFVEPDARASFTGLDQTASWLDMVRSVYDSLVLAARDCYTMMGKIPPEIRLTGGAAKSTALRCIMASALNRPVRTVSREEAGAAGAAMIAAVCQGVFEDITAATDAWVLPALQPPVHPDNELVHVYDCLFDAYLATRQAMPPVWSAQSRMRSRFA